MRKIRYDPNSRESLNLEEVWKPIPGFSNYQISSFGRIWNNRQNKPMKTSKTMEGVPKILLFDDFGVRRTKTVLKILSEAFISRPYALWDTPMVLDGNPANLALENIVWRPRWLAWKYARQLKTPQPLHFQNLAVINTTTGVIYESVIEAGMAEGMLFDRIWRCTYNRHDKIYGPWPDFEIIKFQNHRRKNETQPEG
jgi:hypothetical protein